uniref:Uncharacterized protein n=1 Tax=Rhizophora mucronata TaxID=61149 RepID=A0A2P2N1U7_RHIMU
MFKSELDQDRESTKAHILFLFEQQKKNFFPNVTRFSRHKIRSPNAHKYHAVWSKQLNHSR